jgi:hypothetical protein
MQIPSLNNDSGQSEKSIHAFQAYKQKDEPHILPGDVGSIHQETP